MRDLDVLLADAEIVPPSLAGPVTERKCRRHQWVQALALEDGPLDLLGRKKCWRCGKLQDIARSRRGRTARKRGNSLQAKAAKAAGISNIGALGLPEDAGTSRDWLVLQVKSGQGYPRNLDRWLRALTTTADQLRAVVYVETPGPGRRAKRLIVMDYGEFLDWFGPGR